MKPTIINHQEFQDEIERIVLNTGTDYLDAVMVYVEKTGIEVETAAQLIKKSAVIKAKVAAYCTESNLMKTKVKKLPI